MNGTLKFTPEEVPTIRKVLEASDYLPQTVTEKVERIRKASPTFRGWEPNDQLDLVRELDVRLARRATKSQAAPAPPTPSAGLHPAAAGSVAPPPKQGATQRMLQPTPQVLPVPAHAPEIGPIEMTEQGLERARIEINRLSREGRNVGELVRRYDAARFELSMQEEEQGLPVGLPSAPMKPGRLPSLVPAGPGVPLSGIPFLPKAVAEAAPRMGKEFEKRLGLNEPTIPVSELVAKLGGKLPEDAPLALKAIVGAGQGTADIISGLSTPENLALLTGMMLVPWTTMPRIVKILADAGFSYSTAKAAANDLVKLYKAYRRGANAQELARYGTTAAINSLFSYLAARAGVATTVEGVEAAKKMGEARERGRVRVTLARERALPPAPAEVVAPPPGVPPEPPAAAPESPPAAPAKGPKGPAVIVLPKEGVGATIPACVAAETQISGIPIAEWNGGTVETLLGRASSTASFIKGRADLYRVSLADGRSIVATLQHRFLTQLGWRRLEELNEGSLVACAKLIDFRQNREIVDLSALEDNSEKVKTALLVFFRVNNFFSRRRQVSSRDFDPYTLRVLDDHNVANAIWTLSPKHVEPSTHKIRANRQLMYGSNGAVGKISGWIYGSEIRTPEFVRARGTTVDASFRQSFIWDFCPALFTEFRCELYSFLASFLSNVCSLALPRTELRAMLQALFRHARTALNTEWHSNLIMGQKTGTVNDQLPIAWQEINQIKWVKNGEFYDLTVPLLGHYEAAGFWNHNSTPFAPVSQLRPGGVVPEGLPRVQPHLDNAEGLPGGSGTWSLYLLDKGDLIASEGGVDHYKVGNKDFIVMPSGSVREQKPGQAQAEFEKAVRRVGRVAQGRPEAAAPPALAKEPSGLDYKALVEGISGMQFKGVLEGNLWYHDTETGSTGAMPLERFNPDDLRRQVEASRAKFAAAKAAPKALGEAPAAPERPAVTPQPTAPAPPPPAEEKPAAKAKEPWEMTQAEFAKAVKQTKSGKDSYIVLPNGQRWLVPGTRSFRAGVEQTHGALVATAIEQGKPVPPEVLKDYPQLAKSVPPPTPAERRQDRQLRSEVNEHMQLSGETDRQAALREVLAARQEIQSGAIGELRTEPRAVLAGITTDDTGHRTVSDPKEFRQSLAAGAPLPDGTLSAPPDLVVLAPEQMQFRSAEGQLARRAARGEIRTWEPTFAGAIDVWFDPKDQRVKVVNGHHRLEYAKALDQPSLEIRFMRAGSAQEARSKGALKNIAEGAATPYDAGLFFRASGLGPEELANSGIVVTGSLARDGLSLARLAEDLFERVRKGEMTERTGVAIGASLESPELQRGLAGVVEREAKRGKKLSPDEIAALAAGRVLRVGQTVQVVQTLFGPESIAESNAVEAARLEAYIKRRLASDRRLFGYVSNDRRAYILSKAGNVITVDENRKIHLAASAAEEAFNRLLYKAGPVEDAILDGATRLKRGEDADAVKQSVYQTIYEAVRAVVGPGPTGREGIPGRRPENAPPTAPAGAARLPGEPPPAAAVGGGTSPNVAVQGGLAGGVGTGDVVPTERGMAQAAEPGTAQGAGGLVRQPGIPGEELAEPDYGTKNKLITKDQAERFRERIRAKLGTVRAGIDPELLSASVGLGIYHFEAGARTFGDWSGRMIAEAGDWVAPFLDRLWAFVSHRVRTDEALQRVAPASVHVPIDARTPVRDAGEWSLGLHEANIESRAPAPKVRLSEANAKKLVYLGQKELTELALSALTRPGLEKPGFVLASSTGTGKTFVASAILAELKPETALILTTNHGLVAKSTRVGKEFGLDIKQLPRAVTAPPGPGIWIATYATAIGRPGLETYPWKMVIADESGAGRRWWLSSTGKMLRRLSQSADRTLYMSATPFHTPLELGYADNLGIWKKGDFERWVGQFGVHQDENGEWIAPANPKRFAKLRLQMTEAGVFVNLSPSLDGYTAAFGVVPLTADQRSNLGNVKRAFDTAVDYFTRRRRTMMTRAARAGRVMYSKAYLERIRLPAAIELAKKARAQGWQVGLFTETRTGSEGIYDFLKEVDGATGGAITRLLPPLPDVMKTMRDAFGDDFANFSGKHSELRQSELDDFNNGAKPVLAATYAAGGLGVDMDDRHGEHPRLAIYLGPPWSGVMLEQAVGRFWRFGTKSDVLAVFLTSDSKAEFQLVHGKVVPRLASLRALIKGIHSDPFVKSMESIEDALDYEHGEAAAPDADDFVVKVQSNSILPYNQLEIPSADTAKNRGLAIPRTDEAGQAPEAPKFGDANKVFTRKDSERHEENFREHMDELRGGFDPTMVNDLLHIAGFYFEGGIREFGKWSQALVDRFGEGVRPYLAEVWKSVSEREGLKLQPPKLKPPKAKVEELALSGLEPAAQAQEAAAAKETGRQLTEKIGLAPISIDMAAGNMERSAPLFRGTEAAPQREMFGAIPPTPTAGGAPGPPEPAQLTAKQIALQEYRQIEAKIFQGRTAPDMVLVAAARALGAGLHKTSFWLAMKRAGVPIDEINRAVKATWEAGHVETPDTELRWSTKRRARQAPIAPGPGAKTAGPPETAGTPAEQMARALKAAREARKGKPRARPVPAPSVPPGPAPEPLARPQGALGEVLDFMRKAWTAIDVGRPITDFETLLGDFLSTLEWNVWELRPLRDEMRKEVPDKLRAEAIANWINSHRDPEALRRYASLSKGEIKEGYLAALTLTDEEKRFADNVSNLFEAYGQLAQDEGYLGELLEDYVPQWRKPKEAAKLINDLRGGGILRTDWPSAKKRIFRDFFEGEQQGFPARTKDIRYLVLAYIRSFVKAKAGRHLIDALRLKSADDGLPIAVVSGLGRTRTNLTSGERVHLIFPHVIYLEHPDRYGPAIPHPALHGWIWAGKDEKGNPILMQGDMRIHKQFHRHLYNVLTPSYFRRRDAAWPAKLAGLGLRAGSVIKGTFLGPLATFHQVQIAQNTLFHLTLPFGRVIDQSDPDQVAGVKAGLLIADPDGSIQPEEGLASGGLWEKIPGFGGFAAAYVKMVFEHYVPERNMGIYLAALKRNRALYKGKYSDAQIIRMSAGEANATTGFINYLALGRNKTFQDVLRMIFLAPQYEEAGLRVMGQAMKPGGAEQRLAFLIGASLLILSAYTVAHALQAGGADARWNPRHPFSVQVGGKEYDLRNKVMDNVRAVVDTWGFLKARLNPWFGRPSLEAIRERDWRGTQRSFTEQAEDYFKGLVPIWFQGLTQQGRTFWESALSTLGLHVRMYHSEAEALALKYHQEDVAGRSRRHETAEMRERRKAVAKLVDEKRKGVEVPQDKIDKLLASGELSPSDVTRINLTQKGKTALEGLFWSLSLRDRLDVWEKANPQERKVLRPALWPQSRRDVQELRSLPDREREDLLRKLGAAQATESPAPPPLPSQLAAPPPPPPTM